MAPPDGFDYYLATQISRIMRSLWETNKNRSHEDWNTRISFVTQLLDTTEEVVRYSSEVFWNNEKRERLRITSREVRESLKKIYYGIWPKLESKEYTYYDFEILQIVPKNKTIKGTEKYHARLNLVFNEIYKTALKEVNSDRLERCARNFNRTANYLNGKLHPDIPIPFAVDSRERTNIQKKNYLRGIFFCPATGDELDITTQPPWVQELDQLLKSGKTLEWIKTERRSIYIELTEYHRTQVIPIHGKDNKKCVWLKQYLLYYVERYINFISAGKCKFTPENINTLHTVSLDKKTSLWQLQPPKIGGLFVKCVCINDGKECNMCFNLSDPVVLNMFKQKFANPPAEATDKINTLFRLIKNSVNPKKYSSRINSKCPKCGFCNTRNAEAFLNERGHNIHLKHPTDVNCDQCHHAYCTDCFETHPRRICRGFVKGTDPGPKYQACPRCQVTTERVTGCTFIKCQNPECNAMWCWMCRCLRHEEQLADADGSRNHYCPLETHYTANPQWADNLDFLPYISNAPLLGEDMDIVPL
jgi:hypothetical protein